MKLGEMIALRRKSLGLTQEDLAFEIGADLERVQTFENGKPISGMFYFPIAKVLGLRTSVICNWDDAFKIVDEWDPEISDEFDEIDQADSRRLYLFIAAYGIPLDRVNETMYRLYNDTRSREERVAYNWARELTREDVVMLAIVRGMSQEKRSSVLAEIRKRQDNR